MVESQCNGAMDVKIFLVFGQIPCLNSLSYTSYRAGLQNIQGSCILAPYSQCYSGNT